MRNGTTPNGDQLLPDWSTIPHSAAGPCWVHEAPSAARILVKQGRHSHSLSQQAGGAERSRFSARNVGAQIPLPCFSFPLASWYSPQLGFLPSPSAALHGEGRLQRRAQLPGCSAPSVGNVGWWREGRGKGAGGEGDPPEPPRAPSVR